MVETRKLVQLGHVYQSAWVMEEFHSFIDNFRMTSVLIAVSDKASEAAITREGAKPTKIKIVLNGIPQKSDFKQGALNVIKETIHKTSKRIN